MSDGLLERGAVSADPPAESTPPRWSGTWPPAFVALRGYLQPPMLRGAGRRLLDTLLPPTCLACRQPIAAHGALCAACWATIRFIERPYCERLGTPFAYDLGAGALSAAAIANPPPYGRARAVALYEGMARDLVHALKYRDRMEIAPLLGGWMVRSGREVLEGADLIVPVPLHRMRLWHRRFNQAAALAAIIARRSGVPCDPLLLARIRRTRQQVGLSGAARAANVSGAFRVREAGRPTLHGRRIVLVDDVLTTGATIAAATRALKRAGAAEVDVLVFARVAGPAA